VDRARDMYISGGENVYPAEIEKVLAEDPRIEEVAVMGVPDDIWGEVGLAFVIRKHGSTVTEQDLLTMCRERLAGYKLPKKIVFCDDFPRTPLGKVRKFLLKERIETDPPIEE
jgi:fatty-acyl-CoA synthase